MYGGTAGTGHLCVARGGAGCEAAQHLEERKSITRRKRGGTKMMNSLAIESRCV